MRTRIPLLLLAPLVGVACGSDPSPAGSDGGVSAVDAPGAGRSDARPSGAADVGVRTASARPDGGAVTSNPCRGVGTLERCVSPRQAQYCAIATGRSDERIVTQDCDEGETCQMSAEGFRCVQTSECAAGQAECSDDRTLRTCMAGQWQAEACANGCVSGVTGATCAQAAETVMRRGRFRYQTRVANRAFTEWDDPTWVTDAGFTVALQRGAGIVSAVRTASDGTFTLAVPAAPTADDRILVMPVAFRNGAPVVAVGNPGYAPSTTRREGDDIPSARRVWSWSWDLAMLGADGELALDLTADRGSGAADVFAWMRTAYERSRTLYGRPGKSVIAWVGLGTSWACGACYTGVEYRLDALRFDAQAWLDGSERSQGYWSSSVTAHEMGHWWMDSFSTPPGEGGPHEVGVATFPGQAWSEGFASFVSADLRNDALYVDNQEGIFYLDLERMRTRPAGGDAEAAILTPEADNQDGAMQFLDENWVSAAMWRMRGSDAAPLYRALASERMRLRPFPGCYNRHQWNGVGTEATDVCDSGESAPFFGDLLDALSCSGFDRALLGRATSPLPYDPAMARCTAGQRPTGRCSTYAYPACPSEETRAPMRATLDPLSDRDGVARLRLTLERSGYLPGPYALALDLPAGARRVDGPARFEVPSVPRGGRWSKELVIAHGPAPAGDLTVHVDARRPEVGWHGLAHYRFGRPEPLPAPMPRARETLRINGLDLGAPVPVLERPSPVFPAGPAPTTTR